jgi:CheY-like chemotaxis protein
MLNFLVVNAKSGYINVMSSEGTEKVQPHELAWQSPALAKPPLLVFHINDNTDDQVIFQAACKRAAVPFQWHIAESSERGISYLDSLVALSRNTSVRWPDLLVLDVVMPGGSGLKVLQHVRKTPELQLLPVVILTGNPSPEIRGEALRLGANSFHTKPTDFAGMVEFVKSLYAIWSIAKRPAL